MAASVTLGQLPPLLLRRVAILLMFTLSLVCVIAVGALGFQTYMNPIINKGVVGFKFSSLTMRSQEPK
jgi:hypothetical protein